MERRQQVGAALLALSLVLLALPLVFQVQPVREHETWDDVDVPPDETVDETLLRERGATVVAWENLSERGRELYVRTLREGGRYAVPSGSGAPDFSYPTDAEQEAAFESAEGERRYPPGTYVIERPTDGSLPPADEEDRSARYDLIRTETDRPSFPASTHLPGLAGVVFGSLAVGLGGYLYSTPRSR